jgi:hypothetical protein
MHRYPPTCRGSLPKNQNHGYNTALEAIVRLWLLAIRSEGALRTLMNSSVLYINLRPWTNSALAACIFPALFASLILVDPVILEPRDLGQVDKSDQLSFGALSRREQWPSR